MRLFMASDTQCNQVSFGIISGVATKLPVMDFQIRHCTARLAPPAIAAQDLLPQLIV